MPKVIDTHIRQAVLTRLQAGQTFRQISAELGISPGSVTNIRQSQRPEANEVKRKRKLSAKVQEVLIQAAWISRYPTKLICALLAPFIPELPTESSNAGSVAGSVSSKTVQRLLDAAGVGTDYQDSCWEKAESLVLHRISVVWNRQGEWVSGQMLCLFERHTGVFNLQVATEITWGGLSQQVDMFVRRYHKIALQRVVLTQEYDNANSSDITPRAVVMPVATSEVKKTLRADIKQMNSMIFKKGIPVLTRNTPIELPGEHDTLESLNKVLRGKIAEYKQKARDRIVWKKGYEEEISPVKRMTNYNKAKHGKNVNYYCN
jgi:hypothetical protein